MRVSAGESITQAIPFKNESQIGWQIQIILTKGKENPNWFEFEKDLSVFPNSTAEYKIVFSP